MLDLNVFVGQSLLVPLQLSATSHTFAAARHTAVLFTSGPHVVLVPLHLSATSHTPAAARHTVLELAKPSAGQSPLVPVHCSATSHCPVDGRHVTVSAAKASTHVSAVPEQ